MTKNQTMVLFRRSSRSPRSLPSKTHQFPDSDGASNNTRWEPLYPGKPSDTKTWLGFLQHGRSEDRIFSCHTMEMAASDHMRAAAEARRYRTCRRMSAPGASSVTSPCQRHGRRQPREKARESIQKQKRPNGLGPVQTGRNWAAPRRSRHRRGTWNGAVPLPLPTPKSGVPSPHHHSAEFYKPLLRLPYTKPCFISDRATQLSSLPPPLSAHPLFTTPDNHPPTSTHRRPSQPPSLQFHPPSLRMIGSIGALSREKGPALYIPCDQTILLTSHPSIPLQPPLTPLP